MTRSTIQGMTGIILVCLMVALFLSVFGCASLKYETADGTKVAYTRVFTTADTIKGNVGDAKVAVSGQKIDTETLQAILALLGVVATK